MNLALASKQPKEAEDSQNLSEYQNTVSEVPKIGVAACPIPAEKFQVPVQVNDEVVHVNVHLDLSDWLDEQDEYDIEDEWNQMNDCQDHATVHGVEKSSPVVQNHPDYIPFETDLHKCPPIMSKEQLKNMYLECFDGICNEIIPYYDDDAWCAHWILVYSECFIMSACIVQVPVHIYRLNNIYCNVVVGLNAYYGGCINYIHSSDCNTCYIPLLLTKNTFIP